jgi:hypothetical protein
LAFNVHGFHAFAGMTGGGFRPCATNNGQFDRLTDRTETPVPELAEGAPALSPPRAIVNFAYAEFHSWHLSPGGVFHPSATNICQFGKLTDRTENPVPELVEGALSKQYIYTVAHASGSESSVLFPCLMLLLISVSLLLSFPCIFRVFSVKFRVRPWLIFCFCLVLLPCLCFCLFRVIPC